MLLACAAVPLLMSATPTSPAATGSAATRPAATADSATVGLPYVALGDSYSAGYGLQPLTDRPVPGCAQSAQDYPHRLAAALDLDLTDVSCSGAVTADVTSTAQDTGEGTAPPQDAALSSSTRIVTLTIGGDDLGFSQIAAYCVALSRNGPLLAHPLQADCRRHYTAAGPDNLGDKLRTTVSPAVAATLRTIHTRAPNAKVFVLGYPALAPDAADTPPGGCFRPTVGYPLPADGYPFTNTDVPFLLQTEQALDSTISADALAAGDTFVPTLEASVAHTPCAASTQPAGTPWVNGLSLSSLLPPSLQPGALHPDAAGVGYLTTQLTTTIKNAFPPNPTLMDTLAAPRILVPALALIAVGGAILLLRRRRTRTRPAQRH